MLPLQLELRNFLAYRAPEPVVFKGIGLACLTGQNGVGKSSLLDAMTWALWGRARARRDEDLIHLGQSDMSVALDFECEGLRYRVQRRRSRTGAGSRGQLDLWVYGELGARAINENSMRRTQAKINQILRLDFETFVHSAFLQQGRADAFTLKTASERKRILSEILELDQWAGYEAATKTRLSANAAEVDLLQSDLRAIESEVARLPQLQAELDRASQALDKAEARLNDANAAHDEVANSAQTLRRERQNLRELDGRIHDRKADIAAAQGDIDRQRQRIAASQRVIDRRETIEKGYAELQDARSGQSAIAEQLAALQTLDRRTHEIEGELAEQGGRLQREADVIRERMRGLGQTIAAADSADMPALQKRRAQLEALAARRDETKSTMQALGEERSGLQARQGALAAEGAAINERKARLENADGATCPLCGQDLTARHRDDMLAKLDGQLEDMRNDYRRCRDGLNAIADKWTAHEGDLAAWDRQLLDLPGVQQRLGALSETARRADDARDELADEEDGLTRIVERLERQDFGAELRAQLTRLHEERERIGYDSDSHDQLRAKLQRYDRFDREQTQLQVAQQNLPEARRMKDEAAQRKQSLQSALAADEERRKKLADSIETLEGQVKLERELREQVDLRNAAALAARERKTIAEQELRAIDARRERQQALMDRLDTRRHEGGLLQELRLAFGRNGVPAMIIDSAIPELESAANGLLARMTDGRMSLALSTQREKAGGELQETLDIEIADELGARPYELYSGGEAFRINFALRIALSRLLARRAGARLRALFIDEGFGSQDENGRAKLVDAISAIRGDFDLILVITHIDDLRDSFPLHLLVEKGAEGSAVEWR